MPDGRFAEIWGSVAIAYGRIYFTTEEGLYCVGKKGAPFKVTPAKQEPAPGPAVPAAADAKAGVRHHRSRRGHRQGRASR